MDDKYRAFDFVLTCAGIHIFSRRKWDSKAKFAHQICNSIVAVLTCIFTTGFLVVETDVILWIEGVCIWITGAIMYMLVGLSLVYRKEFREFLEEMIFRDGLMDMPIIEHAMKSTSEGKLNELKGLVIKTEEKLVKYPSLLLKSYACSTSSTAVMYVCDAIYQMIVREDESLRLFGFNMWFPWKLENFNVYIATFIFHAYAGFICILVFPGVQTTIILLMGQMVRQLHVLTFIVLHLDDLVMEMVHVRGERWQEECTAILSQCVDQYVKVKRFGNRLNSICRSFYLILILDAIVLVCVCSVKVAISHKLSHELIKYVMHEFFFTLMVLQFCVMGQQIQNECDKLEMAVLEKWYIFNKKHRTHVKIFHMAVIQRMPIYIFGTIPLSLPTFNWFLKTGMSFFTLVMSVLED
ncbi:uncharacterized protein LOC126377567 [Pectinophora gossypiella]|uniref:uncharacterized protein LOC126377567 n=1 Tax=Pectinophora gossypiella TaxID=13191 RepID=UPI00214EC4BC|nr:uncharacterized protein LOC126377567 [Pectinophora gossypiella]